MTGIGSMRPTSGARKLAFGAAVAFALMVGGSVGMLQPTAVQAAAADARSVAFYTEQVVPVFKANCYRCHAGMAHRGGFQMDTKAGMLKGGHDGVVIVPGDPDKSLLVRLMRHEGPADDPMPMPPHKDKVSDADIAIVAQWVKAGAVIPDDAPKP